MATKTTYLRLTLPNNGEYFNTWDQPTNTNFRLIDEAIQVVSEEVIEARGSAESLAARLDTGLDQSGNPLPPPEVISARVSKVYGGFSGSTALQLDTRIDQVDREVWNARQSLPSLVDANSWSVDDNQHNTVLSAANNYITYSNATVRLNADVTPCVANINGYRQVVREDQTASLTGQGAGTYYLTLTRSATGTIYKSDGENGSVGIYDLNGLLAKFSDVGTNFVSLGVKPGDIITITDPTNNPNIGQFMVLATNAEDSENLTVNELAIVGQFKAASANLEYTLTDPASPTFGFTADAHAKTFARVQDKIFIGRAVFDGTNVTGVTIYRERGSYAAFHSVSALGGTFELTVGHNLGYFPKRVLFYASQASDFSQPLEPLSVAEVVTSYDGDTHLQRSVIARYTDLNLEVKNATTDLFYVDYDGVPRDAGFLYVVVER